MKFEDLPGGQHFRGNIEERDYNPLRAIFYEHIVACTYSRICPKDYAIVVIEQLATRQSTHIDLLTGSRWFDEMVDAFVDGTNGLREAIPNGMKAGRRMKQRLAVGEAAIGIQTQLREFRAAQEERIVQALCADLTDENLMHLDDGSATQN